MTVLTTKRLSTSVVLGAVLGVAACTSSTPSPTAASTPSGLCTAASSHGEVAYEKNTTVGTVRQWTGYGGLASVAPKAIRHFSPTAPTSAEAAWCWVSISDGYAVYLAGPAGTTKLIGTFHGSVPSPGGVPVWD